MMKASQQLGIGTGGGMLFSVICQSGIHDVVQTAVLAAIGAVVSFIVTVLLQRWSKRK